MNRIVAILLGVLFGVLLVLAVWVLLTLPRSEKQTSRFHVAHLTVTQRRASLISRASSTCSASNARSSPARAYSVAKLIAKYGLQGQHDEVARATQR